MAFPLLPLIMKKIPIYSLLLFLCIANLNAKITIEKNHEYKVKATFYISAPAKDVWATLTDYNNLHKFIHSINTSYILEKKPELLIFQQFQVRVFLWKKRVNLILKVQEQPFKYILFEDILKKDFLLYKGYWKLEGRKHLTKIYYVLVCLPRNSPSFFQKRKILSLTKSMLEELRKEILKRQKETQIANK